MNPPPALISCLMLTRGQLWPALGAVEDFLSQTWPNKELVIVAVHGDPALRMHLQRHPDARIRYIHIEADGLSTGAQRNLAVALARGEYVAWWHEQAHHDPRRLQTSWQAMHMAGAQALFLGQVQAWQGQQGHLVQLGTQPWLETLVARKQHLPAFADTPHEDNDAWCAAFIAHTKAASLDSSELFSFMDTPDGPTEPTLQKRAASADARISVEGLDHWAKAHAWQPRMAGWAGRWQAVAARPGMDRRSVKCVVTPAQPPFARPVALDTASLKQWPEAAQPLVSCLMVTRGHLMPAQFAVAAFLQQTWAHRELVVVIDQADGTLAPWLASLQDPRIRVLTPPPGLTLGALRNLSVSAAQGEFVVVWDDDDLSDPDRITACMSVVRACQVDIVLLERLLLWWPDKSRLFATSRRPWEGSMLARKACMLPYPDLPKQEDTPVMLQMCQAHRTALLDWPELYVYTVTGRNTWDQPHFENHWRERTLMLSGAHYVATLQALSTRLPMQAYAHALSPSP